MQSPEMKKENKRLARALADYFLEAEERAIKRLYPEGYPEHGPNAHSDESGHRFRLKATTCSDPKRPLWPGVGLGGVIVAVGCSFEVIFALYGQSRWR